MKQFTDEQILSYLIGDSTDAEEIKNLVANNANFADRVKEIETLRVQLKALPFHLASELPKARKLNFIPIAAALIAFVAGGLTHAVFFNHSEVGSPTIAHDQKTFEPKLTHSVSTRGIPDGNTLM